MDHRHEVFRVGPLSACWFSRWNLGFYRETIGVYVLDFGPIQFTWGYE